MLRNILSTILLRKKTISTLLLMIILLGTISYATFPKEEMPEIDLKTVAVIINYDGMSSNEIEKLITEPLERKLMTLKDITEIISISKDNIASFDSTKILVEKLQQQKKVDIKFKPIKGADHFYESYSNEFEDSINEYIKQEIEKS